jgi:hypothetical protein
MFVRITNECGVVWKVSLEMVDGCEGSGQGRVRDELLHQIRGEYNAVMRFVIRDSMRLHFNAFGGFFGFQKHALAYVSAFRWDYVSFRKDVWVGNANVTRRLAFVHFSSETIAINFFVCCQKKAERLTHRRK